MTNTQHEEYAEFLNASGEYRVLRRLEPRTEFEPDPTVPTLDAIALDVEGTGLSIEDGDEIIELGMIRFSFDAEGRIHRVIRSFDRFREPQMAELSDEITALTGISQEMVKGQTISQEEVETFVAGAVLVICFNSAYDRPFCEAAFPVFKDMCWGCALAEIPWRDEEGQTSQRLGDLLANHGYYHEAHRADGDCLALLELLARPLPQTGRRPLSVLLHRARQPSFIVTVENAKGAGGHLRKQGFRWKPRAPDLPGRWTLETTERRAKLAAELLTEDFPGAKVSIRRITAFQRFSSRI